MSPPRPTPPLVVPASGSKTINSHPQSIPVPPAFKPGDPAAPPTAQRATAREPTAADGRPRAGNQRDATHTDPELAMPGPFLLHGAPEAAPAAAHPIAVAHAAPIQIVAGDTIGLAGDPACEMATALRQATYLRRRRLARVIEGRLVDHQDMTNDAATVVLAGEQAEAPVRLEGRFLYAFHRACARLGDIIQIDPEHGHVTVRYDRDAPEGALSEARDFVTFTPLADLDRTWSLESVGDRVTADADDHATSPAPPTQIATDLPLYGTGRALPVDYDDMARTDRWVATQRDDRHNTLTAGVLVVTDAEALPPAALAVLREAVTAGRRGAVVPAIVLHSTERDAVDAWVHAFPHAVRLGEAG